MNDAPNNSDSWIPADAPDDYIVGYEPDGVPIRLKEFNESLEKGLDERRRGYYYIFEDIKRGHEAFFKYLEENPDSNVSIFDFPKRFPEYDARLYHEPDEFQLLEVSFFIDPTLFGGWHHVNVFEVTTERALLSDVFQTDLLDGRYLLNTKEEIMEAMDQKGKKDEEPLHRVSFKWESLVEEKFHALTETELEDQLYKYAEQPDWGVDLPFFLKSVERILELLSKASKRSKILYLNKDEVPESDKIGFDYYGYAILIIVFDMENRKLTTIDLAED